MLFNSVIFIAVFLPLALAGWYLLQRLDSPSPARLFLIGMSLWFYGYYNPYYLWILLVLGILGNLGLLFYFKYFNFFIDNCNFLFHADITVERIADGGCVSGQG